MICKYGFYKVCIDPLLFNLLTLTPRLSGLNVWPTGTMWAQELSMPSMMGVFSSPSSSQFSQPTIQHQNNFIFLCFAGQISQSSFFLEGPMFYICRYALLNLKGYVCYPPEVYLSVRKPYPPIPPKMISFITLVIRQNLLLLHPFWIYFCPFCIYFIL